VLVLMSIELMLNAVNLNLVAFSAYNNNVSGQIFALFVVTIAAAEVGVGLAIVLQLYRLRAGVAVDDVRLDDPADDGADDGADDRADDRADERVAG